MSYSFYVPALKSPPLDELLALLGPDLLLVNEAERTNWPDATITLCRYLQSTRGISLSYSESQLEIRTNVFSSLEDCQLALQLVTVAANATATLPRGEYTEPMPLAELLATHDAAWIRDSLAGALSATKTLIHERGTVGLSGPFRTCYIGPRILQQLDGKSDAAAIDEILALLRKVQWIHTAGYETASNFSIGESKKHIAFWFPSKRMFLPSVDFIGLPRNPSLVVPFDRLADILQRPLTLLDECQPLIEPTPEQELPALLNRAEKFRTKPSEDGAASPSDLPKTESPIARPAPSFPPCSAPASQLLPQKPWWKLW